jgi:hypothetical protein
MRQRWSTTLKHTTNLDLFVGVAGEADEGFLGDRLLGLQLLRGTSCGGGGGGAVAAGAR